MAHPLQAFFKIVLPKAVTGIARDVRLCLILPGMNTPLLLFSQATKLVRLRPVLPTLLGRGGIEWSPSRAGRLGFLIPVVIITFAYAINCCGA